MLRRACAALVSTGSAVETRGHVLGAGDGELPGAGHGLHDDVRFFDAGGEQFGFCAGEEGFDYCCLVVRGSVGGGGTQRRGRGECELTGVPAGVDDANAKAAAIVLLSFARALE
jgi:hypothetical protein